MDRIKEYEKAIDLLHKKQIDLRNLKHKIYESLSSYDVTIKEIIRNADFMEE